MHSLAVINQLTRETEVPLTEPHLGEFLGFIAWAALCALGYLASSLVRAMAARRRRLDNPLLKMAEQDCRYRHPVG